MKLIIDPPFKDYMKDRKITHDEVKETIKNPTRKNAIDINLLEQERTGFMPSSIGPIVYLYLRKYETFYILISTKEVGKICHVTDGFKVNEKLISDIEKLQPMNILERIVEKFGLTTIIDGEERQGIIMFAEVSKDRKGNTKIAAGKSPKGHSFSIRVIVKPRGARMRDYITMLYTINETKLLEWIYTSRI